MRGCRSGRSFPEADRSVARDFRQPGRAGGSEGRPFPSRPLPILGKLKSLAKAPHILLAYTRSKRPKEGALAIESGNVPEPQEDASIVVEHVEGCETEEATYEEAWQIVNERALQGWKLRGMEKAPAGDGVELLWDASDGRRLQG